LAFAFAFTFGEEIGVSLVTEAEGVSAVGFTFPLFIV